MSLENLIHVAKCGTVSCTNMVPVGRIRPEIPRKCTKCKNRIKNEKYKMIKRVRAAKQKRCHTCNGMVLRLGVFCSDYCEWLNQIHLSSHHKAITRVAQIR